MKLLTVLLLFSLTAGAQKKDTLLPAKLALEGPNVIRGSGAIFPIVYERKPPKDFDYMYFDPRDSTVVIHGDTTNILRKILSQYDSTSIKYNEFIRLTVDFINTVPDYFKNSKEWKKLYAELKSRGYRTVKKQ